MNFIHTENAPRSNWFVGANYGGTDDQTQRFVTEGIWENGYSDRHLDIVRSMQPGDRIAIKSSYTRKKDLPFDNRGNAVSVMAIKAIGTITENLSDGTGVRVEWIKQQPPREWYFYTHRGTVWRVLPGDWATDGLLAFAFDGKPQEIARFRSAPFWRERFGPGEDIHRFHWSEFYEAVGDKLLNYRNDRTTLIQGINEIATRLPQLKYLGDQYTDPTKGPPNNGPLKDICPFTVMGTFNRAMTDTNRKTIARELANFLGVDVPIPTSFEGIPVLNPQTSWFFRFSFDRRDDDIEKLWAVFAAASRLAKSDESECLSDFAIAYDAAIKVKMVRWNLSTGLFWAHPWDFLTLDSPSRRYIATHLSLQLGKQEPCDAQNYLRLMESLKSRFNEESYSVHSFPELSLASGLYKGSEPSPPSAQKDASSGTEAIDDDGGQEADQPPPPIDAYSIADVINEGCFLDYNEIKRLLERLRSKNNLILQGPPGTGKTWIAKRLAFAFMGEKDDSRIRTVQFHPNLSYEDFVRGWRPTSEGKLALKDGVFLEAIHAAADDPSSRFVFIIEEINRGNPAHIFGELLTLLEADKRTPDDAIELCYPDAEGRRRKVHVPKNLYLIGTMNIADRSLALVDLAFRRRFAFVTLEPKLGDVWRKWVVEKRGVDSDLARDIERRITTLNLRIAEALGIQFRIGHSYVTPAEPLEVGTTRNWFLQIAETEIGPLLEEYWFDAPKTAKDALDRLIEGW